jgi:hypothetical protein
VNVASLELSKELYAASGWNDTSYAWGTDGLFPLTVVGAGFQKGDVAPAYDLGYLLRKLPYCDLICFSDGKYTAIWEGDDTDLKGRSNSSPENAVARLCIKLFESGVLQPARGDMQ